MELKVTSFNQDIINQLSDSKSARRRSAAKKIRSLRITEAGPQLFQALKKEVKDKRTWETQYQLIMALGHCRYVKSKEFLEALSYEGRVEMVRKALGDSLVRLSSKENDLQKVIEFIERADNFLISGAFQAIAMERIVPDSPDQIQQIVDYGLSITAEKIEANELAWCTIWLLRAIPGWPPNLVAPLIKHFKSIPFDISDQRLVDEALEFLEKRQYGDWSHL